MTDVASPEAPEAPSVPKFQLKIDVNHQGTSSVIPVMWCVSDELIKELTDLKAQNVHVLFSVINTDSNMEMDRKLVPLTRMMTYISFVRAGRNRVLATIVYNDDLAKMKQILLTGSAGDYQTEILNHDKKNFRSNTEFTYGFHDSGPDKKYVTYTCKRLQLHEMRNFQVDPKMFGREWPRWTKDYRNMFTNVKPKDECAMRRFWLFFGWWSFVPMMILNLVLKIIYTPLALLLGLRSIQYKAILKPFSWPKEVTPSSKSVYWYDDRGRLLMKVESTSGWRALLFFYNPPTMLPLVLFVLLIAHGGVHDKVNSLAIAITTLLILPGLFAFIALILSIQWLYREGAAFITGKNKQERKDARELRKERRLEQQKRDAASKATRELSQLESMTCDAVAERPVSLSSVPRENRTITLRFEDAKAKVCKPFAR